MKKFLALLMVLALTMGSAMAMDLEIQMIGGPEAAMVPVSLDDMQVGTTYTIDGYAKVTPKDFRFVDYFAQFNQDADYKSTGRPYNPDGSFVGYEGKKGDYIRGYNQASWMDSGLNADFMWLQLDVTNAQKTGVNFMEEIAVKVVYADEYEFAGWVRQANFDYNTSVMRNHWEDNGGPFAVIHPENEETVNMMYTGTFIIGCTLPNSVVEDKQSPLRIEITMGDNDLTYNIRK